MYIHSIGDSVSNGFLPETRSSLSVPPPCRTNSSAKAGTIFCFVKCAGVPAFASCKLGNLELGAEFVFCSSLVFSKLAGSKSQLASLWGN